MATDSKTEAMEWSFPCNPAAPSSNMYDQAALQGQVFGKLCRREGYHLPLVPYVNAVKTVMKDIIKPRQQELSEANFGEYCGIPIVMWARHAKRHDPNEVAFIVDDEQSFVWLQEWADFTWSDRAHMESNLGIEPFQ